MLVGVTTDYEGIVPYLPELGSSRKINRPKTPRNHRQISGHYALCRWVLLWKSNNS